MPHAPHLRRFFGHRWRTITRPAILRRAGGVFENGIYLGGARCMRCQIPDAMPLSVWQRSEIECAHLDGNVEDDSEENTAALCFRCHKAVDYKSWAIAYRAWLERQRAERIERLDKGRPILQLLQEAAS